MMGFKRTATLVALVAVAAGTMASFEMMLVGDSWNRRIHRYDAETGTYLGSFGHALPPGLIDIVASATTGTCYALIGTNTGPAIQSYNFHTGRFLGEVILPVGPVGKLSLAANGEFLVGRSDALYRYNAAGVQQGVPLKYFDNNFDYQTGGGVQHSSGNYYVFGDAANATWASDFVMALNSASVWQGNYPVPGAAASAFFVDGVVSGDKFATLLYGPNLITGRILNKNSANASLTQQHSFSLGVNSIRAAVEFGHTSSLMYLTYGLQDAGQPEGTMYRMMPIATNSLALGQEMLMPQVGSLSGTAMILAPEPGSMIVLGLGAAALLAKRRRK